MLQELKTIFTNYKMKFVSLFTCVQIKRFPTEITGLWKNIFFLISNDTGFECQSDIIFSVHH